MRILSITAQKPHSTGSGTYLTELVRSWDRAGHSQAVVCGIYPDDSIDFPDGVSCYPVFFKDTAKKEGAAASSLFAPCKAGSEGSAAPRLTHDLPFPIVGMSDIMPYTSTRYRDLTPEMIAQFEAAFIAAVERAVADLDPDLIVCHHLFLLTAMVRKHFPDRKIFGISHGSDLRQVVNCRDLRATVQPEIAKLDMALALHEAHRSRIHDLLELDEDKIQVIGSGYNNRLFNSDMRATRADLAQYAEGSPVPVMICYAGKISDAKGIPELLKAFEALSAEPGVPFFEATLAGGCPDSAMQALMNDLPDNISWLGQIPQDRLADVFRYNDIFVLPSFYEGLPLVLIEAMASGMVPVSTDLPGVRPWIESNVPHHNVRFIPMPEMASVDQPTEAGRSKFISDLTDILRELITEIANPSNDAAPQPDTSGITWDGVASRILALA